MAVNKFKTGDRIAYIGSDNLPLLEKLQVYTVDSVVRNIIRVVVNDEEVPIYTTDCRLVDDAHYFRSKDIVLCTSSHEEFGLYAGTMYEVDKFIFNKNVNDNKVSFKGNGEEYTTYPASWFRLVKGKLNIDEDVMAKEELPTEEVTLRITKELFNEVAILAAKADMAFSDYVAKILEDDIQKSDF